MRRSDGLKPVGLGEREALGRCVGVTTGGAALSLDSVGEVAAAARDNVSKPLKIQDSQIHKYKVHRSHWTGLERLAVTRQRLQTSQDSSWLGLDHQTHFSVGRTTHCYMFRPF